jgi:hypothetical protein
MKKCFKSWLNPRIKFLASLLCALPICVSAQSKTNTPAPKPHGTNDFVAPQATFIQPKNRDEGRDPFFPRSSYPYVRDIPVVAPTNPVQTAVVNVDLKLKAISGLPPHRLALINNHTFEAGEEAEVITTTGRMTIKCLEVHEESATVQVGPERRVLRMKSY